MGTMLNTAVECYLRAETLARGTRNEYGGEDFQDLPELLELGWQPVRESMMGGGSAAGGAVLAFSLVLLERDLPPAAIPVAEAG